VLGVNLVFAGFALTLNGLSYLTAVDERVKMAVNIFVGAVIAINAVLQTQIAIAAGEPAAFGFAAATWLFAINYFVIAAHLFFKSTNWKVFGLYSLFASIVSLTFATETVVLGGPGVLVYLWLMWALLWAQSFLAILVGLKAVDKLTPYVLITNGIASTFVPGLLILLGVIL